MSKSYKSFIETNPLYIHNNLESLNSDINNIRSNVSLDNKVFYNAITKLREEEVKIYKTLGNGNIEDGKKLFQNMIKNIYIDNDKRQKVIELTRKLFGHMTVKSKNHENFLKKISDKNGMIDPVKLEKERQRLEKQGKDIKDKFDYKAIKASFRLEKDKKTGAIISKSISAMRGTTKVTDLSEIQELVTLYCNNWNNTVQNYDDTMLQISSLLKEGGINSNNTSIDKLGIYFDSLKKELKAASIDGKIDISLLSDNFYELFMKKGSYFGNVIGLFTEYCDYVFESKVLEEFERLGINPHSIRGDDILREDTGVATNAKADEVIMITGDIKSPSRVTIPVSLKFRSDSLYKAHSGTISSIANLIQQEGGNNGILYSNYFKYILINAPYWQNHGMESYKDIIMKILNNFAYTFISGGLEQNNLAKAVFINGTFLEGDTYENYFLPVADLLREIYYLLKNEEEVLVWSAFKEKTLNIKDYYDSLEEISNIKRNALKENKNNSYEIYNNPLVIETAKKIFEKFSSEVNSTDITFNHKIFTENLFKGRKGIL